MDLYHALQCQAMQAVLKPDRDAWLRHVQRWYSHKFHTPLPSVADLPMEEVILAYYESSFEDMEDEEREEHLQKLMETDAEREAREALDVKGEQAGDELFEALNRQVQEDVEKGKVPAKYEPKRKGGIRDRLARLQKRGALQQMQEDSKSAPGGQAAPAEQTERRMTFDDEGNLSSDIQAPRPQKKE